MANSLPHNIELRPYQSDAVHWMANTPKGILADDTGLGKTPTATAALVKNLPALVIARGYNTPYWFDEVTRMVPNARVNAPDGTLSARQKAIDGDESDITIISYTTLRALRLPLPTRYRTVVVDEAHNVRNYKAAQSKRTHLLCAAADNAYLLTATPYYKSDEDIYNLLRIVSPTDFPSYWDFIREWFSVNWEADYTPKIYGIAKHKREAWQQFVSQYMLKRTPEEVGRWLPPIIERTIRFRMPRQLQQVYDTAKQNWQIAGTPIEDVGTLLTTLRSLTMCPQKIETVSSIIEDHPNVPTLIWVWYKESAQRIREALQGKALVITGDVAIQRRHEMLHSHRESYTHLPIIATIEALSEGFNLEYIRNVIYAEETYVRGEHYQSLRRAQRDRGDTNTDTQPVNVWYVRARGTIDERIPDIRNSRGHASELRQLAQALQAN